MPTNLPPECVELEERYKTAISVDEKIAALEEYIFVHHHFLMSTARTHHALV